MVQWRERLRELLSDGELGLQLFATMLPDLLDCMEQFPLKAESSSHPLTAYGAWNPYEHFPGTLEIADNLGIKHPRVYGDGDRGDWVPTTDLLLVQKTDGARYQLLAISSKAEAVDNMRPRTRELLCLEREYWRHRHAQWLLITPDEYEKRVVLTLRRTAPWALDMSVAPNHRALAVETAAAMPNHSLTQILDCITGVLGDHLLAQQALWQAVCKRPTQTVLTLRA